MASTANSQSVFNVFVYGSLLADDVVHALLKRVPPSNPAILHNYHRFSIKGRVYPAILPVENKKVTGKVLLDITVPELNILDIFEDIEYERTTVDVSLMDSSKTLQAETYVWVDKKDPNLFGEWDFEVNVRSYISVPLLIACWTKIRRFQEEYTFFSSPILLSFHFDWTVHLENVSCCKGYIYFLVA
ncbi:PREDICTED: AIG2-like protein D isoform X1 [Nicotiana attenuata]|uniref:AIG2-like protein D isoform X1 n=1 Tax=Nicotiana attenuata TaxID=49451 RepID=UPI0009048507|nr:PREDICTED: AIG2-like protein D isoform X1 [Nicotiana attenuata]